LGREGRILMAAVSWDGGEGPWMACVLTCLLGYEDRKLCDFCWLCQFS
jgi:hypothetical protein